MDIYTDPVFRKTDKALLRLADQDVCEYRVSGEVTEELMMDALSYQELSSISGPHTENDLDIKRL